RMKLQHRISKLERSRLFVGRRPVLERLLAAVDEAAIRLAGKKDASIRRDQATEEMILDSLAREFYPFLSEFYLEELMAELERIGCGSEGEGPQRKLYAIAEAQQ